MFALAAALALSVSSVLVVGSPASAGSCGNPYTGTPPSYLKIISPDRVERGERARIVVLTGTYGNLEPTGRVALTVVRSEGGFRWKDAKRYDGGRLRFRTPALDRRGKYVVSARFFADPAPCVGDSDNRDRFRVTRRG